MRCQWKRLFLLTGAFVGLSCCLAAQADPPGTVTSGRALYKLAVAHQQGWGQVGLDHAAHAPGTAPLSLRIGSREFSSGLGVHAPALTVLALDGQYESFEAYAGVQWQGGTGTGSVIMTATVDGQKVFDSGILREGADPIPVRIPLKGAQELRLEVSDVGDGITCDAANWAAPRLVPDPQAARKVSGPAVDIAPFARMLAWDPARTEGTRASRLETMSAEDLYPETPVTAGPDGTIRVPVFPDGRSCVGLEWLEWRRLARLALVFPDGAALPRDIAVEYWRMPEAGSRWQGTWNTLPGQAEQEGQTWLFYPDWTAIPEGTPYGTLKVRFIFPPTEQAVSLRQIRAFSRCRYEEAVLRVQAETSDPDASGTVEVYNGALAESSVPVRTWRLGEPLDLRLIHAAPASWQQVEQTVLRFRLPQDAFGVAVRDVLEQGAVYVPHAGLLVTDASRPSPTPDACREQVNKGKTILDRVRELPEQTLDQAMSKTSLPDLVTAPTMLSLACDNRKFVVSRQGDISFEDDPAVYNQVSGVVREHACRVEVRPEGENPDMLRRALENDSWYPILHIKRSGEHFRMENRIFVAPYAPADPEKPVWWRDWVMGVSAYTLHPDPDTTLNLTLNFSTKTAEPITISRDSDPHIMLVHHAKRLVAGVVADPERIRMEADQNTLRIAARDRARFVMFFPAWENAEPAVIPDLDAAEALLQDTRSYWDALLSGGARFDLPDPLLNRLIPASIVHCYLAARNDNGRTVAPWIASMAYGPLESEAHSVIRGMMHMGQDDFARRGLEYFIDRYNEQGFLTTGYTVLGTGWHLWTLGEYVRLSHNLSWLSNHADAVAKVCRWVMSERRKTMQTDASGDRVPEYGLMPPGVLADWNVFAYYFYLNGNYCAGLRDAGESLKAIGYPGAEEIVADAESFRQDILRACDIARSRTPVVRLENGAWVPYYPCQLLSPLPIEFLYGGEDMGRSWCYDVELGSHHLAPMGILPAEDQRTDWIIQHMEDVQFFRPGWFQFTDEAANRADWFNRGGFAKVQPYYARTVELHALRDDPKPFLRSYFNAIASLLNPEDLSIWEHFVAGAFNKTHETGYFLHQSRLMLAQERNRELWLAPFIPSAWLESGKRVAVENLPTGFGTVSFTIASRVDQGYLEANIAPPQNDPPQSVVLRLRLPGNLEIRHVDADGAGSAEILDSRREIRLTLTGPAKQHIHVRVKTENPGI